VVRDQAAEAAVDAEGLQVPGAVQRMKPGLSQRRGIADVVQPRGGDQRLALLSGQHGGSDPAGLRGGGLHMRPAAGAERREELLGVAAGPLRKRPAPTIPALTPGGRCLPRDASCCRVTYSPLTTTEVSSRSCEGGR
jgi:hypothetical protein